RHRSACTSTTHSHNNLLTYSPAPKVASRCSAKSTQLLLRRRCGYSGVIHSLCKQAKLADACRTNAIDRIHHLAIVRPLIGAHENFFAGLILQLGRDLGTEVVQGYLISAEKRS